MAGALRSTFASHEGMTAVTVPIGSATLLDAGDGQGDPASAARPRGWESSGSGAMVAVLLLLLVLVRLVTDAGEAAVDGILASTRRNTAAARRRRCPPSRPVGRRSRGQAERTPGCSGPHCFNAAPRKGHHPYTTLLRERSRRRGPRPVCSSAQVRWAATTTKDDEKKHDKGGGKHS